MKAGQRPGPADYLAVGCLSAAALAYEIILLRVFSYTQWHHFASLAVSLALLGFGVAGTLLTLLGNRAIRKGNAFFLGSMILGGVSLLLVFLMFQHIRLRPLFAVWDTSELARLLLLNFACFIPFLGFGLGIGQVLVRWPRSTPRLYAANLGGSGLGSLLAVFLLALFLPETAFMCLPLLVLATSGVYALVRTRSRLLPLLFLAGASGVGIWTGTGLPDFPLSDFKTLSRIRDLPDAQVVSRKPGLRSTTTLMRSGSIRIAPGLSLQWQSNIPAQDALLLGSNQLIPLPGPDNLDHYTATLGCLPFLLRGEGKILHLGTGNWLPPFYPPGRSLTWIEDNPAILSAFEGRGLLESVKALRDSPRRFLAGTSECFRIIYFDHATFTEDSASGDYLLTKESFRQALDRLESDGLIAVPMALQNPPRWMPKLLELARQSLSRKAPGEEWRHIAVMRSLHEGLLLASRSPLSADDLDNIRAFSATWGFDLVALPGLTAPEANQFNVLDEAPYFHFAEAVLHGSQPLPLEVDWYSWRAPTDDSPHFWYSMKWRKVPDLLKSLGLQGWVWLDWTPLILAINLLAAAIIAAALILLPLGRLPRANQKPAVSQVFTYFSALGLGFLILEMVVYQRCILFLGDPVITAAVVFSAFLVGSGTGSLSTPDPGSEKAIQRIFLPVMLFAAFAWILLHLAGNPILRLSLVPRLAVVFLAIIPLAWSLGRPMPWGLRQLDHSRSYIPWAWGINGFASVLAAPVAVLLTVQSTQLLTWLTGTALYILAWRSARSLSR